MRRSILARPSSYPFSAHSPQSSYICASCRHEALRQRSLQRQPRRNASSGLPATERLRRKIWGTDNPPGLKDPYGGPSYFERRRQQAQEEQGGPMPAPSDSAEAELESATFDSLEDIVEDAFPSRSVPQNDPEKEDPAYVHAETWDGLEHVGLTGHWSEKPPIPGESFQPFLAIYKKATDWQEILSSLHQAVVEVITLRDSGLVVTSNLGHIDYGPETLASISDTTIAFDGTSEQFVLEYGDGGKQEILDAISGLNQTPLLPAALPKSADAVVEDFKADKDLQHKTPDGFQEVPLEETNIEAREVEESQALSLRSNNEEIDHTPRMNCNGEPGDLPLKERTSYVVMSTDFLVMPLRSPELRFAIIKRASQLTGYRISDPQLTMAKTLRPIYFHFRQHTKPKPKKLSDLLVRKKVVASLPNVQILSRRETPVDKDKRFGRWKIIEAELQSKGLPVLSKSRLTL